MQKPFELSKKLLIRYKNYLLFLVFFTLAIFLNLYVEYKFQYTQFKWLDRRIILIFLAIFQYGSLPEKLRKKIKPAVISIIFLLGMLYAANFLANYFNVYHLDKYQSVTNFCQSKPSICLLANQYFYKLKLYRFVSLTGYFFLTLILLFSGLLVSSPIYKLINRIWQQNFTTSTPKISFRYIWLFYILLFLLFFQQLNFILAIASNKTVKIISTLPLPFEERWEVVMGGRDSFGFIKTLADFIKTQVPPGAILLIPNRDSPWSMEGNPEYIRWFLYPIKITQMLESNDIPSEVEYIMISYGVFDIHKNVFPNFPIGKEKIAKIILIDKETLEIQEIIGEDFIPENYQNKWGVIKLK